MTPNPKDKAAEKDREIERLSRVCDDERAATLVVARDLRVKLRYNRFLNRAIQAGSSPSDSPILLPWERKD